MSEIESIFLFENEVKNLKPYLRLQRYRLKSAEAEEASSYLRMLKKNLLLLRLKKASQKKIRRIGWKIRESEKKVQHMKRLARKAGEKVRSTKNIVVLSVMDVEACEKLGYVGQLHTVDTAFEEDAELKKKLKARGTLSFMMRERKRNRC